jgi:hypothetical protein
MRRALHLSVFSLLTVIALGTTACDKVALHRSFGQRYRDVNMAQLNAHPAHEPTMRGPEASAVTQAYFDSLSEITDTKGASSGGGSGGASNKTAGVSPLH